MNKAKKALKGLVKQPSIRISTHTKDVLDDILTERINQDKKWGIQNHSFEEWYVILGEEYGEVGRAICEMQKNWRPFFKRKPTKAELNHYREELIQTAAVAVAMVECMERREL
jgi:hypothetical protein